MVNSARVEITAKALKVLKIETAICGIGQKETLEALILRGASAQSLAVVEGRTVIPKMESLPKEELIPQADIATENHKKALDRKKAQATAAEDKRDKGPKMPEGTKADGRKQFNGATEERQVSDTKTTTKRKPNTKTEETKVPKKPEGYQGSSTDVEWTEMP
jgi:hypothetical protein